MRNSLLRASVNVVLAWGSCVYAISAPAQIGPEELPAWKQLNYALNLLESGQSRIKVIAALESCIRLDKQKRFAGQVSELLPLMRAELKGESRLRNSKPEQSDHLPLKERLTYNIDRFIEVHGSQLGEPGFCETVGEGESTKYSDAVVRVGRPAIPALIEILSDSRPTRSIGHRMIYFHILRVQDVAVACIEAISGCKFFEPRSSVSYLSMGPEERTKSTIDEIKEWWKRNGSRPVIDGYIDWLDSLVRAKAHVPDRVVMLEKIEKIDSRRVRATAMLKSWASEVTKDPETFSFLAKELGKRGDKSLLPEIRGILNREKEYVPTDCLWFLLTFGDDQDWTNVRSRVRQDTAAYRGEQMAAQIVELAPGKDTMNEDTVEDSRFVPMLVELLHFRDSRGGTSSYSISIADEPMQSLIHFTRHNEGYRYDQPEKKRFAAIDRWIAWWDKSGRRR